MRTSYDLLVIEQTRRPDLVHPEAPPRALVDRRVHGVPRRDAAAGAGKRILDVGCGTGTAEVSLARLRLSQMRSVRRRHLVHERVRDGAHRDPRHQRARWLCRRGRCQLPFADSDRSTRPTAWPCCSTSRDVPRRAGRVARVTRPGGPVLAVEPDNAARYWFSSLPSGMEAFELRLAAFFAGVAAAPASPPTAAVGPLVPGLLRGRRRRAVVGAAVPGFGLHLGAPPAKLWDARRAARQPRSTRRPTKRSARLGTDYLEAIDDYARDADAAGPAFVEIQNTMLFATVGQRAECSDQRRDESLERRGWSPGALRRAPRHRQDGSRAGTSTRPSTTGRTRRPWRAATSRSGGGWRRRTSGPVLELGCGTGRITLPVARAGVQARRHRSLGADARRAPASGCGARRLADRALLVRGDIRSLPFRRGAASSRDGALRHPAVADARADLAATLASVRRVLRRAGCSASISCPTCRAGRVRAATSLSGRADGRGTLTLIESVRQDGPAG